MGTALQLASEFVILSSFAVEQLDKLQRNSHVHNLHIHMTIMHQILTSLNIKNERTIQVQSYSVILHQKCKS